MARREPDWHVGEQIQCVVSSSFTPTQQSETTDTPSDVACLLISDPHGFLITDCLHDDVCEQPLQPNKIPNFDKPMQFSDVDQVGSWLSCFSSVRHWANIIHQTLYSRYHWYQRLHYVAQLASNFCFLNNQLCCMWQKFMSHASCILFLYLQTVSSTESTSKKHKSLA